MEMLGVFFNLSQKKLSFFLFSEKKTLSFIYSLRRDKYQFSATI